MFETWDDPLRMISLAGRGIDPGVRAQLHKELELYLRSIESALKQTEPVARAKTLSQAGTRPWAACFSASGEQANRLVSAYGKVVAEEGLAGRQPAERGILTSLVAGANESLIEFFSGLFDVTIARDRFSPQRRVFAAAGLGVLVRAKGSHSALTALLEATGHANADVAVAAVRALRTLYEVSLPVVFVRTERPRIRPLHVAPPHEVLERLNLTAQQHPAFLARFHARRALQCLGASAPLDNPQGAYQFKLTVEQHPGFSARLLVPSSAPFVSIVSLSLGALRWDFDHLYSFFLSGKRNDILTQYPLDHEEGGAAEPAFQVGQVGLAAGVKFICLYDFGDSNIFKYTCEKIIPDAEGVTGGSITEKKGTCPRQYHSW